MSREDPFDGMVDMVDADDFDAANQRTLDLLDLFRLLIRSALEEYPQGDLYEFLSLETTSFAVYAMKRDLISFEDIGSFFRGCGFNEETVTWMVQDYYAVLNPQPPLEPALAAEVEVYREWSKRKS
ncbi:hypothetical protein ES707_20000 [subsurface metagenome]